MPPRQRPRPHPPSSMSSSPPRPSTPSTAWPRSSASDPTRSATLSSSSSTLSWRIAPRRRSRPSSRSSARAYRPGPSTSSSASARASTTSSISSSSRRPPGPLSPPPLRWWLAPRTTSRGHPPTASPSTTSGAPSSSTPSRRSTGLTATRASSTSSPPLTAAPTDLTFLSSVSSPPSSSLRWVAKWRPKRSPASSSPAHSNLPPTLMCSFAALLRARWRRLASRCPSAPSRMRFGRVWWYCWRMSTRGFALRRCGQLAGSSLRSESGSTWSQSRRDSSRSFCLPFLCDGAPLPRKPPPKTNVLWMMTPTCYSRWLPRSLENSCTPRRSAKKTFFASTPSRPLLGWRLAMVLSFDATVRSIPRESPSLCRRSTLPSCAPSWSVWHATPTKRCGGFWPLDFTRRCESCRPWDDRKSS
mmetsp:Transcript_18502/g.45541  ORF Transcript_18502/g.45541 Transcript_18502/m.45541 type:complete len:415 (+) Transcript_18502:1984-3228(+)